MQAELAGTAHASLAATARLSAEGARDSTRQAARLARELGQATVEATEANELAARLEREGSPLAERARQTLREAVAAIEPAARASQASAQEAARVTEQAITAIANLKTAAGAFVSSVARDALDSSFAVARVGLSTAVEQTVIMVGHGVEWLARGATIVLADYVGGSTIAEVFEFLLGADMILPVGDGLNEDRAVRSRNVPSHEYGHFVMCNLLERADPVRFRIAYNEAAADGVLGQSADKQHVVINQASADFFNGQIAGAANYWDPDRAFGGDYCPTAAPDTCWEDNVGGPGQKTLTNPDPFNEQVAVVSSIFHDSFDGHDLARDQARPTNGNPWGTASGAAITYDTLGSHASDEVVALPGGDIFPWIRRVLGRGTLLRFENVFSGLSETMAARNLNWCQRCEVFRLHSKNPQSCPEAWVGPRPPGLVCAWEPCSPPNIIIPDKRICDTCKSNFSFCSYDEATMGCVCPVL